MIATNSPLLPIFNPLGIKDPQKYVLPERETKPPVTTTKGEDSNLRINKPIYNKFQPQEKKLISRIYTIIAETIQNNSVRDVLIDKIEAEITK